MNGKFRKRSEGVWCPKPREIFDIKSYTKQSDELHKQLARNELTDEEFNKKLKGLQSVEGIPRRMARFTGWMNMMFCDGCPHLEEYHIDNDGVFCLYPNKNTGEQSQ